MLVGPVLNGMVVGIITTGLTTSLVGYDTNLNGKTVSMHSIIPISLSFSQSFNCFTQLLQSGRVMGVTSKTTFFLPRFSVLYQFSFP